MITFNGSPVPLTKFPNQETCIAKPFFSEAKLDKGNRIVLQYESDEELFQLLLIRKALWFPCELHITYFPYSRMDRKSDAYIFTLKTVTKFINWMDWDKVVIYEPHSDVTPALLNKCKIVDIIPKLLAKTDFDITKDFVLYPDAGAYKKYSEAIKSQDELVGIKKRDFTTGRITEMQITVMDIEKAGNRVFVIDDLCSKGGTFIMAAEAVRKMGATKVFLVVAHCEETIVKGKILETDLIDKVYTTTSIPFHFSYNEDRMIRFPIENFM